MPTCIWNVTIERPEKQMKYTLPCMCVYYYAKYTLLSEVNSVFIERKNFLCTILSYHGVSVYFFFFFLTLLIPYVSYLYWRRTWRDGKRTDTTGLGKQSVRPFSVCEVEKKTFCRFFHTNPVREPRIGRQNTNTFPPIFAKTVR